MVVAAAVRRRRRLRRQYGGGGDSAAAVAAWRRRSGGSSLAAALAARRCRQRGDGGGSSMAAAAARRRWQLAVIALLARWLNEESAVRRMVVLARWVDEESAARRMAVPSPARRRVGGGACSSLAGATMSWRQGEWRFSLCWLAGSTMRGPMAMERDVELAAELSAVLARRSLARRRVGLAGSTKSWRRGEWRWCSLVAVLTAS
jgi:hypothetical protein